MKTKIYIFIITIILFTIVSCEKEVDWETKEMPVMLTVEGSITNEFKKHQVKLSLSADYFYNKPVPVVSDASVSITDGINIFEFAENPAGSGIYETIDSVAGVAGKTYTLNIDLKEPVNGTYHYYANAQLIKGIDIDSIQAFIYENPVYMEDTGMDSLITVLILFGHEPSNIKNYYQLNLYDNNVLLSDTVDEISVISDKNGMNGEMVSSFFFFHQYDEGDTVQFELLSVEESYFDFIEGVQNIASQSADPFNMSGPSANAPGNIMGADAIGFFKTAYISQASTLAVYYIDK